MWLNEIMFLGSVLLVSFIRCKVHYFAFDVLKKGTSELILIILVSE